MKHVGLSILFVLVMFNTAFADTFVRGSATWMPEQEASVTPPGGGADAEFDLNSSFGAQAEVGVYSPMRLLSFGVKGTLENLRGFNPVAGVESVDAQVYSLMGNLCANVHNRSRLTPYACGGAGLFWIDPTLTLPGGTNITMTPVTASGYSAEVGLRYAAARNFSLHGGLNWRDTFDEPIIGVSSIPGSGMPVDIGRFAIVLGAEFDFLSK